MSVGLIGFIVALILLMILVYKKLNLVIVSLICCVVVALTSRMPILEWSYVKI